MQQYPQGTVTRHVCNTNIEIVEYPLRLDELPSSLLAQIADLAQLGVVMQ
jgi:hypothetical protein